MKRRHVLEFEDQSWFPGWIRDAMTRLIVVFSRVIGATDALALLVRRATKKSGLSAVVDLGSGSGGVMPDVIERVRQEDPDAELTMCDLYPNRAAIARFNTDEEAPHLRYLAEPVDARQIGAAPKGLKVMTNSFHHMRPEDARAILASAKESSEPILIYELTDNKVPFPLWCIGLVIGLPLVFLIALVLTPAVRPLTARQLVFTYLIPIVPILYAWDGQASMPRIYGLRDLDELLDGLHGDNYRWEKGVAKTPKGKAAGIYLLGMPEASS